MESSPRGLSTEPDIQIAKSWNECRSKLLEEVVSEYAILMLDPAGYVTTWNAGAEGIKGYKGYEIVGRHFSIFYCADDIAAGLPQHGLDIAAAQGRFAGDGWRLRKDGSRFFARFVIIAVHDQSGHLLGFGKMTRDLTDRKTAEHVLKDANEALELRVLERTQWLATLTKGFEAEVEERIVLESKRSEAMELLEATFEAVPAPMSISEPPNKIVMWNESAEAAFGHTAPEMIAHGLTAIVPSAKPGDLDSILDVVKAGPANIDLELLHGDGRLLDVRASVVPLFKPDGTLRALVSLYEDITLKHGVEAQLRQSQKMEAIGTLTGGLAHDFNNLLGIIIGSLDLLRESRPDDPEVQDLSGEALDAAMRGAELTRSLLAFARRQPLQPVRLDLDILIGGFVKLVSRLLGGNIEIVLDLAEGICPVVADPAQLESALTNLATNARDAMPGGGKLTIATSHRQLDANYAAANPEVTPGVYAMIEVTDTGAGMSADVKAKIFEPFFSTKAERGTGLGLSMAFGFMKQSGGHISVHSEIGRGTTFRLYFPCSVVADEKNIELTQGGAFAGSGETVLVVDDSEPLRRIVVRQLRGLGYRVLEAEGGAEALSVLESEKVDLLFSDVVMPKGIDGFELADSAVRKCPDLKVVLTSGYPQSRFAAGAKPSPFYLLNKPYRKDNLAHILRSVLDGGHDVAMG